MIWRPGECGLDNSASAKLDLLREFRTKLGGSKLSKCFVEELQFSGLGTNPKFPGTGIDVEPDFLLNLLLGVAGGEDFDTDFG